MATVDETPIPRLRTGPGPVHRPAPPPTRVASAAPVHVSPVVLPLSARGSLPGSAFRHCSVVTFCGPAPGDSIFLHPFAPRALPRFIATMGALTPAGRPARVVRNAKQVSLLTCVQRPTIPPAITPCRPGGRVWFCHPGLPRAGGPRTAAPLFPGRSVNWASPLTRGLATTTGRNRFVILRTGRSPPVALHPASRRRSYLWLRGADPPRRGLSPRCFTTITGARVAA